MNPRARLSKRLRNRGCLGAGVLAALISMAGGPAQAAAPIHPSASARPASAGTPAGVDDWPTFHHDPGRGGVSLETSVNASTAASLALAWKGAIGASCASCISYSSPTVAYIPTLGQSIVYVGDQEGDLSAFSAATGVLDWRFTIKLPVGHPSWQNPNIEGTPAISTSNNAVYFGASDGDLYVLNAQTGASECTFNDATDGYGGGRIAASPLIEDGVSAVPGYSTPQDVAYFGDNGQSGNVTPGGNGGNEWAVDVTPGSSGFCKLLWRIGPFGNPPSGQLGAGTYTSPAWAVEGNGTRLVVFGTTDPDDEIYAVNATTGVIDWKFQTLQGSDSDVGAAATISLPGVNGFTDGVVYDTGKDGYVYALNLTTGASIWHYQLSNNHPSQSSAALVGDTLYEGYGGGEIALNASNGSVVWNNTGIPANISSPAVSGPLGDQVLLLGDLTGANTTGPTPSTLWGLDLANGVVVFHTVPDPSDSRSFFFASPAVSTGRIFISGSDGYLYAYRPSVPTTYTPLPPYRAVDTRSPSCMQCGTGALGPGETRTFTVGGYKPTGYTGSVVPATAAAVTLNVTAVDPTSSTYLTVFPAGSARPLASNLNPAAHSIIAALVTVKLGTGGGIAVYNPVGSINVVVDVEGYFTQSSGTTGRFHSVAPAVRVCDTRSGQGTLCNSGTSNPLGAQAARAVSIATPAGIPSGSAAAVVLNLVGIDGTAGTYLTAYPPDPTTHACGTPPTASNLNLAAHTVQANRVVVPIDPSSGDVCIYNAAGQINFLIDVNGWFGGSSDSLASSGLFFHPLAPFRICDTRAGSGLPCQGQSIGSGSILTVQAAGEGSLPSTSGFVLLGNATVLPYLSSTYVTVYSAGSSRPGTSDINPLHNKVTTNMVYVRVSSTGVAVFNASGTIDFILDVAGWFA